MWSDSFSPMKQLPTSDSGRYTHEFVNHAEAYVRGNVHTNGIENFWSLLKRGLGGTYVSVEPSTCSAMSTNRLFGSTIGTDMNDGDRFRELASRIVGKRLTFAEVTGKVGKKRARQLIR